ncbi:MAG TPA: hypothetical protein VN924_09060 [Bryobacteraceae bacterium]|nr:hypothetical protein [Bryobacteraceae bacterium]
MNEALYFVGPRRKSPNAPAAVQNGACASPASSASNPWLDFEWFWPSKIERDVIERALTLDFLPEARNLVRRD